MWLLFDLVVATHTVEGLAQKWFLQLFDSSLRSLRISVISALNISRDYSDAEITEIRRDRRENFKSRQVLLLCKALLKSES